MTNPPTHAPRYPTESELAQLWEWLQSNPDNGGYGFEKENWFERFYFAVIDGFTTGGPGYAGKVIYMIWDGWPDQIEVFCVEDGRIVHDSAHGADRCGGRPADEGTEE